MTLAEIEPREEEPKQLTRFSVAALAHEGEELAHHMVRSEYVEENWTVYLGPVAVMLARKLDSQLAKDTKQRTATQVKHLAIGLGVEDDDVRKACKKLVDYGLAAWSERDSTYYLARRWPAVPTAIRTERHREALLSLPDEVLA